MAGEANAILIVMPPGCQCRKTAVSKLLRNVPFLTSIEMSPFFGFSLLYFPDLIFHREISRQDQNRSHALDRAGTLQ